MITKLIACYSIEHHRQETAAEFELKREHEQQEVADVHSMQKEDRC